MGTEYSPFIYSIKKNNDIYIENRKIELQNFKNEIYKSIVVKFKNRPNLLQYLAIELIADENVNFVII